MQRKTVFYLAYFVVLSLVFGGFIYAISINTNVHFTGEVKTIGIVLEDNVGNPISSFDWGLVDKGGIYTQNAYLKNTGGVNVVVSMTHTLDGSIGTFGWDSEGITINAGLRVAVVFSLTVSTTTSATTFSYDATIVATEI